VVSTEGGMDIEEVAHKTPEKILTFSVDPATGIMPHHGRRVAQTLKLSGDLAKQIETILPKLYAAFTSKDMSLLEINPLVVTKDNKIICLDAKVGFDGNALYRHADVVALRDLTEEDEKEIEASKYDLNYIALDGSIGCMVNGAGLAMATMDIIKLYGMAPANFLDVHAAFGRDHKGNARGLTVDQRREIELAVDGRALLDVQPVDLLAVRPRLMRDQRGPQNACGFLFNVVDRFHDLDAASLAAATGVNLRLHDPYRTAQFLGAVDGLVHAESGNAAPHRNAEFTQYRLRLIFVDIHATRRFS
jgi:hypothetical protein